jgi:hypothetical protein
MRLLDRTEISKISNSIKNLELNDARLNLKMHANIISATQSESTLRKTVQPENMENKNALPIASTESDFKIGDKEWLKTVETARQVESRSFDHATRSAAAAKSLVQ